MSKLVITEELRKQHGFGKRTETVSVPSQRSHRAWDKTQDRVLKFLEKVGSASRLEIARDLGRSKSPYLIRGLEKLARNGVLIRDVKRHPNSADVIVYRLGIR